MPEVLFILGSSVLEASAIRITHIMESILTNLKL